MAPAAKAEDVTLTVWSHEADEPAKVALREQAARNLEASHPGVHVKITWYEKDGLYTALRRRCRPARGRMSSISSRTRPNTSPTATSSRSTTW